MQLAAHEQQTLLQIASSVICSTVRRVETADSTIDIALSPALLAPAGCFVSLHQAPSHKLRGCVGRIRADRPLIEAVRGAAADVLRDPRFWDEPVRPDDLPTIELEISVLSPARRVASAAEYEPLRDGIIVRFGGRTGLFLPQVARETGWSREQLLARLCTEKLGLPADSWQDPDAELEVFSTAILGPTPLLDPVLHF